MQPNVAQRVHQGQNRQKLGHNQHARGRQLSLDDPMFVCNFTAASQTWLPGTVVGKRGPLSLDLQLEDGQVINDMLTMSKYAHAMHTKENGDNCSMLQYHFQWLPLRRR